MWLIRQCKTFAKDCIKAVVTVWTLIMNPIPITFNVFIMWSEQDFLCIIKLQYKHTHKEMWYCYKINIITVFFLLF